MGSTNKITEQLGFGNGGYPMRVAEEKRVSSRLKLAPEQMIPFDDYDTFRLEIKMREHLVGLRDDWLGGFIEEFRSLSRRHVRRLSPCASYVSQVFYLWRWNDRSLPQLIAGKELELAELFLSIFVIPEDYEGSLIICRDFFANPAVKMSVTASYEALSSEQKTKILTLCRRFGGGVTENFTDSSPLMMDLAAKHPVALVPVYIRIRGNSAIKRACLASFEQNPEAACHLFDDIDPGGLSVEGYSSERKQFGEDLQEILEAVPLSHRTAVLKAACAHLGNRFGVLDRVESEFVDICPVDQRDDLRAYVIQQREVYDQRFAAWKAKIDA